MSDYRAIRIERGSGGFGGPLTVMPEEGKDKVVFITGGGAEPDIIVLPDGLQILRRNLL